ncbi:MAG: penicillin-binding protein 1A [Alphaproteobacteria bacterium]|nr:penicillin-binding protein 1A [Alphaproteobacteria bacterium]MCW5739407.1 penicillin-binding protein 1A [Alphaproteobacteria bacterium]
MIRWMMYAGFAAIVCVVGGAVGVYWHFAPGLPDHKQLTDYQPPTTTRLYTADGKLLAEYAREKRVFVPVAAMPKRLVQAFVAAEDQRFFRHPGVDPIGIGRALMTNLRNMGQGRRPEGASSITQQVAKNFLVGGEATIQRKIREAILALRIENAFSKQRILELYLNEIYLGGGNYGVAAAALNYFDKSLDELSLSEMAYLAALPKAPNRYHIKRNPEGAHNRRDYVLNRMLEDGYISEAEMAAARAEKLALRRRVDPPELATAEFFAEEVRRNLLTAYGDKGLYEGGMTVRTTLDFAVQKLADEALRDGLIAYDRKHGWRGATEKLTSVDGWQDRLKRHLRERPFTGPPSWRPAVVLDIDKNVVQVGTLDGEGVLQRDKDSPRGKTLPNQRVGALSQRWTDIVQPGDIIAVEPQAPPAAGKPQVYGLRQIPNVDGALLVMDIKTGRILAMSGGWSYQRSQYNRATQAMRQPGSSFKPFVYLAAMEAGLTPSTLVLDGPIEIQPGRNQPVWRPTNYGGDFLGPTTVRQGLEKSRNLMTVRMAKFIGMDRVARIARDFGVDENMRLFLPLSLGAGETTLLRMTMGYAMMGNGTKRITPSLVDRVQDRNGRTVFRHDPRSCDGCAADGVPVDGQMPSIVDRRQPFMDPALTYQVVNMMQGVTTRGTAARLAALRRPIAGKTGTTNDAKDVWFIGMTPDVVIGVYVGFDDPRTLGPGETGGGTAVPIFEQVARTLLKDKSPTPFRVPPGLRMLRVNPHTGQRMHSGEPGSIWEGFKPGTEPTEDDWQVLDGVSPFRLPGSPVPTPDAAERDVIAVAPPSGQDPPVMGADGALRPYAPTTSGGIAPRPPNPGAPSLTGTGETY